MTKPFVYLAVPYSHDDPSVVEDRFNAVNQFAAKLIAEGHHVISPISMCHPIAMQGNLPGDWEYWQKYAKKCLSVCHSMYILMLDGWQGSQGVNAEIEIAMELGLDTQYFLPENLSAEKPQNAETQIN